MPRVTVSGVPAWVPIDPLLAPGDWRAFGPGAWTAELKRSTAAALVARLRGLHPGGSALEVEVVPPLKRSLIRAARSEEAILRRHTTPGFTRAGARLDRQGRYSLTPEALALELGGAAAGRHVVDATCGCGGNTIGFARSGCSVVAVERDAGRLGMARHNARLYGVADRIHFVQGSAEERIEGLGHDLLFVDPPWGLDHNRARTTPAQLPELPPILEAAAGYAEIWLKLPPSFDPATLPGAIPGAWFGRNTGDRHRIKFLLLRSIR
ncbi:MAG TPA: hypothetical protein ENK18_17000 [Deltaproteobacteria bacterium]|nr:hypothetical protein [Deltaproteobacteria bacterium]